MEVLYAVEGLTDAPVADKLIRWLGRLPRPIHTSGGSSSIDRNLGRWAETSNHAPLLVMRDWDQIDNVDCVPALLLKLLQGRTPTPTLALRVPVRAVEAWLMADRDAAAAYFRTTKIPLSPDIEANPKLSLIQACRSSPAAISRLMVPPLNSSAAVGQSYGATVSRFAREHWSPVRARLNSPSLNRTMDRMAQLVASGIW